MSREIRFRCWNNCLREYIPEDELMDSFGEYLKENHLYIEQYTGLTDKNGKEIYEGDIVKAKIQGFWETGPNTICEGKATWNLEVVYNEIRYMDVFHILGSKNAPDRIYYLFDEELSELEVIGNIHENPELLESK